jgi:putrescine:ornithine antiporter
MQRLGSLIAACAIAFCAVVTPAGAQKPGASTGTLARIRQAGKVNLGYRTEARPFSYKDEAGNAAGFAIAMCMEVVDALKAELALPTLSVQWVPATFETVQQGKVDLLCAADVPTAERRQVVSFSIPIFPNGIGALVRTDASPDLRNALMGTKRSDPNWRASASALLSKQSFAFVENTASQQWVREKQGEFRLTAQLVPVNNYDTGARRVLDHAVGVLFGDRAMLLDAAARSAEPNKLMVLDRRFTQEPLALALARGDEDFRLFVDRALSKLYRSLELNAIYNKWFRTPDANALTFYQWMAVPE